MPSKYRLTWLFFFTAATVVFFIAGIAALAQDSIIPWHEEEKVEDVLRETILWRSLVLDFKNQLAKGAADKNLKISFLNTPLGKHTIEDLLAYTISGDGSVTTQMHDTVKQILLQPEELYWMWQFLLEHGLENLPDSEADDPESAEFRISLRVGAKGKTIRLYNSRNTREREIIWQYLYAFGLRLLQTAGLSDRNKPIMPVCLGITDVQEINTDNDGLIDWLKLKLKFYSFKSGDFIVGFCGGKRKIFLPQGNSEHFLYINSCLIKCKDRGLYDFSRITISTQPGHPKGPYVFNLNVNTASYAGRQDMRASPDISGYGSEPLRFTARLNDEFFMEILLDGHEEGRAIIRFTVNDVQPQNVVLGMEDEQVVVRMNDPLFLHDIECMVSVLKLAKVEGSSAIFEVTWIIPDQSAIANKIAYFNEAFAGGHYLGDKERARLSLDNALACKEAIEHADDLRVNVIYATPPL